MQKWKCKDCGHIGYAVWIHNDDKCERCHSRYLIAITEKDGKCKK